jgi:hypothetical protein
MPFQPAIFFGFLVGALVPLSLRTPVVATVRDLSGRANGAARSSCRRPRAILGPSLGALEPFPPRQPRPGLRVGAKEQVPVQLTNTPLVPTTLQSAKAKLDAHSSVLPFLKKHDDLLNEH